MEYIIIEIALSVFITLRLIGSRIYIDILLSKERKRENYQNLKQKICGLLSGRRRRIYKCIVGTWTNQFDFWLTIRDDNDDDDDDQHTRKFVDKTGNNTKKIFFFLLNKKYLVFLDNIFCLFLCLRGYLSLIYSIEGWGGSRGVQRGSRK